MNAYFFGLGLLAGIAQLVWLLRGVRSRSARSAFAALARLVLVAVVLLVAARAGHIFAGSAGWAAGFSLAFAISLVRRSWA